MILRFRPIGIARRAVLARGPARLRIVEGAAVLGLYPQVLSPTVSYAEGTRKDNQRYRKSMKEGQTTYWTWGAPSPTFPAERHIADASLSEKKGAEPWKPPQIKSRKPA